MNQLAERAAPGADGRVPEIGSEVESGVLEALASRLDATPSDPWLFWRPGWRWRWRSWEEVADQAARGAEVIRRAAESASRPGCRLAFEHRIEPDAVALALAIQAAGATAWPIAPDLAGGRGGPSWATRVAVAAEGSVVGTRDDAGTVPTEGDAPWLLPACRSRFGTETLVRPPRRGGRLGMGHGMTGEELGGWIETLRRPLEEGAGGRAIVCAGPGLDPVVFQGLVIASALGGAAVMLEGDPEIFPAAVAWARPSVVVAEGTILERTVEVLAERRRLRRLRWVVIPPPETEGEIDGEIDGEIGGEPGSETRQRLADLGAVWVDGASGSTA